MADEAVTWYDANDAAGQGRILEDWPDAPVDRARVLRMLLDTARDQVTAFGPVLAAGAAVPERFVFAQLMQAQNLWMAGQVQSSGDYGDGGFTFTPRPLDKTVRAVIRPTDGTPNVY